MDSQEHMPAWLFSFPPMGFLYITTYHHIIMGLVMHAVAVCAKTEIQTLYLIHQKEPRNKPKGTRHLELLKDYLFMMLSCFLKLEAEIGRKTGQS